MQLGLSTRVAAEPDRLESAEQIAAVIGQLQDRKSG